ncbi:hypothetical protein QUB37_06050 [Microcoleus sp. AT3-A2]|uniref:hypothetical protein n=1 Tax=unclassified Microcoleus TaxID=2642155 RepID=UPI002FD1009B
MNIARLDNFDTSLNFPGTVVSGFASVTGLAGHLMWVRMGGAIVLYDSRLSQPLVM